MPPPLGSTQTPPLASLSPDDQLRVEAGNMQREGYNINPAPVQGQGGGDPYQNVQPTLTISQYADMQRKAELRGDRKAADYAAAMQAKLGNKLAPKSVDLERTSEDDDPYTVGNVLGAAIEPNLSLLSGIVSTPVAGIAGILRGATNLGEQALGLEQGRPAEEAVRDWQNALTYTPKSQGGKYGTQAISYPFEKLHEFGDYVGGSSVDALSRLGVSPSLAAGVGAGMDTLIEGVPQVLGGKIAGKAADFSPRQKIADLAGKYSPALKTKIERPQPSPDVVQLTKKNVWPTMGQVGSVSGRTFIRDTLSRLEESLSRNPLLGGPIRAARGRPVIEHAYAQLNETRKLLGLKDVEPGTVPLPDAIDQTIAEVNRRYDSILTRTKGDIDLTTLQGQGGATLTSGKRNNLVGNLSDILTESRIGGKDARGLTDPKDYIRLSRWVEYIMKQASPYVDPLHKGGEIDGFKLKEIDQQLRDEIRVNTKKGGITDMEFAHYLQRVRDAFKSMIEVNNPGAVHEIHNLDVVRARLGMVDRAMQRARGKPVFTPLQMRLEIEKRAGKMPEGETLLRKGEMAGQDLADPALRVLTPHLPNSGTPEALIANAELAGDVMAGAEGVGDPVTRTAGLLSSIFGVSGLYSRPVQHAIVRSIIEGKTPIPKRVMQLAPAGSTAAPKAQQGEDDETQRLRQEIEDLGK